MGSPTVYEIVEAHARAAYADAAQHHRPEERTPWEVRSEETRDKWRNSARAALAAVLPMLGERFAEAAHIELASQAKGLWNASDIRASDALSNALDDVRKAIERLAAIMADEVAVEGKLIK